MPLHPFRHFRPKSQLSAFELNRLAQATEEQDRVTATAGGVTVRRNAGGFQLVPDERLGFWAKITGSAAGTPTPHSWTEQQENDDGTLSDYAEGRTGTTTVSPAYALDGGTIPTGTKLWLLFGVGETYYLALAMGSTTTMSFRGAKYNKDVASPQTIATATSPFVTLGDLFFDPESIFDFGVTNQVFTIPRQGYYHLGYEVSWQAAAAGGMTYTNFDISSIPTGGVANGPQCFETEELDSANDISYSASTILHLEATNEVRLQVSHTAAANRVVTYAEAWLYLLAEGA